MNKYESLWNMLDICKDEIKFLNQELDECKKELDVYKTKYAEELDKQVKLYEEYILLLDDKVSIKDDIKEEEIRKIFEMDNEVNCGTCANNVEYPPPHTCDVCTSLDEEDYCVWEAKGKV